MPEGMSRRHESVGAAAVLASAAALGMSSPLTVLALRGLTPADLLAVQLGGMALTLVVAAAATGRLRSAALVRDGAPRAGVARALGQGALVPAAALLLANLGLTRTSATNGALLLSAETPIVVLLGVIMLHERVPARARLALVVGLGGTALVTVGGGGFGRNPFLGNLLVLGSSAAAAAFTISSRRTNVRNGELDLLAVTALQATGGLLTVTPYVLWSWLSSGSTLGTASATDWGWAGAVLAANIAALALFNIGIRRVEASHAAQLFTLNPVVGALGAVLVLGEPLLAVQAVGGALVLAGLVLLVPPHRPHGIGPSDPAGTHLTPAAPSATRVA